jgi:hypothetical protein
MTTTVAGTGKGIRRLRLAGGGFALGFLGLSVFGCSGFAANNCAESRTCPHGPPETDADAGGFATGGAAGSSGASGKGGSGGGLPNGAGGGAGTAAAGSPAMAGIDAGSPPIDAAIDAPDDVPSRDADVADAHADAAAEAGPRTCAAGFADCNREAKDGCEVDLTKDATSCGACGHACATVNTSGVACIASVCKPTCAGGYADCKTPASTLADDGCEANLNVGTTCGACNHDCLGGACSSQRCQPVTLASGLTQPHGLAADGKDVYWTDRTGGGPRVMYAPVSVGAATLMANEDADTVIGNSLVSNGKYVMWATANTGGSMNPNGWIWISYPGVGGASIVYRWADPLSIAIDEKHAYFSDANDGLVHQVLLESGTTVDVPLSTSPTGAGEMVVDATNVYFLKGVLTLGSLSLGSGPVSEVTPQSPGIYSSELAADAKNLYFWGLDSSTSPVAFNLLRLPKTLLGNPVQVARAPTANLGAPTATDASFVYFAESDGVYRVSNAGGTAQRIASSADIPVQIVVNGGAVYWIDPGTSSGTGAVMKLAVFPN